MLELPSDTMCCTNVVYVKVGPSSLMLANIKHCSNAWCLQSCGLLLHLSSQIMFLCQTVYFIFLSSGRGKFYFVIAGTFVLRYVYYAGLPHSMKSLIHRGYFFAYFLYFYDMILLSCIFCDIIIF